MNFITIPTQEMKELLERCTNNKLIDFVRFIYDVVDKSEQTIEKNKFYTTKKYIIVKFILSVLSKNENIIKIYHKLISTPLSKYVYDKLIWNNFDISTKYLEETFQHRLPLNKMENELSLVTRERYNSYDGTIDNITIDEDIQSILKLVYQVPNDYNIRTVEKLEDTQYSYNNEDGIFNFINIISDMLQNNLIEFGKTGDKPLLKILNNVKVATGINEFYTTKKLDSFATDMLTRSFYSYYSKQKKFQSSELLSLKDFVTKEFQTHYEFLITRVLASHLKKVRYTNYYFSEIKLFSIMKQVISDIAQKGWIDIKHILRFLDYRSLAFSFETEYQTDEYTLEGDSYYYNCNGYYQEIFFEPIVKGMFFYLASLGVVEIKYNQPLSNSEIKAKGKEYISVWDGLKYIKITELGKYIFNITYKYEQIKIVKKSTKKIKFDEYKPIVSIDKQDAITRAKLESFTDIYDDNRYILSYAKIFKDCKSYKALTLKIDSFYANIEKNPPQVFKDFFNEIKENSNLLKRDLKQVVIELKNNKKLLNLFMNNKKLRELIIKAEGYRVIVLKVDVPKLTKIVKDNGFFIEF